MTFIFEFIMNLLGIEVEPSLIISLRVISIVSFLLTVLYYATMWRLYQKAGRHGWAAIIPFYQFWVLADISTKNNIIWFILSVVPIGICNLIAWAYMMFQLPKRFGKGNGFAAANVVFGVFILPFVAFGKAEYLGDFERNKESKTENNT